MVPQDFELILHQKLRKAGLALLKEHVDTLTLANIRSMLDTPLGRDLGDVRVVDLFRIDFSDPSAAEEAMMAQIEEAERELEREFAKIDKEVAERKLERALASEAQLAALRHLEVLALAAKQRSVQIQALTSGREHVRAEMPDFASIHLAREWLDTVAVPGADPFESMTARLGTALVEAHERLSAAEQDLERPNLAPNPIAALISEEVEEAKGRFDGACADACGRPPPVRAELSLRFTAARVWCNATAVRRERGVPPLEMPPPEGEPLAAGGRRAGCRRRRRRGRLY